ncbi:MAG: response regulator [Archangium sp.]|nr:response regulator [Archangium sp.]MDP3156082.1 response regulator [Archangium sp.]MDP3572840.1 response regulator [Archangium sp.]
MSPKILIVEDTQTITALIQIYLMGQNIQFMVAADGAQGLARAREFLPTLILSDVQMPVMDGFALCAAVRADLQLSHTPVVLLTSLNDGASRAKGRLVGASGFLCKPVSVVELRAKVAEFLKPATPSTAGGP